MKFKFLFFVAISAMFVACKSDQNSGPLPYLGKQKMVDGEATKHIIPDWEYVNQDSLSVSNKDLTPYIYVADFFFRSCPTICPRVMKEMKEIYKEFEDDQRVKLVSFTIDPKRDTPENLKSYATNLQVDTDKWWFIHTEKESIYDLANEYFVVAYEDKDIPGGFDHSGKIILVDREGHVRSFSEGTEPETTPKLIADIKKLLNEEFPQN